MGLRFRRYRFAVIEDDYDHEFHCEGRPVLPLASIDRIGSVIYVGSLSKVPGLRIGFIVAPRPLIEAATAFRTFIDTQGDQILESAVADLLYVGEVQRHVRRVRREYMIRRSVLVEALSRQLGSALRFTVPAGGMALWAHVASGIDVERWAAAARQQAVALRERPHL